MVVQPVPRPWVARVGGFSQPVVLCSTGKETNRESVLLLHPNLFRVQAKKAMDSRPCFHAFTQFVKFPSGKAVIILTL